MTQKQKDLVERYARALYEARREVLPENAPLPAWDERAPDGKGYMWSIRQETRRIAHVQLKLLGLVN